MHIQMYYYMTQGGIFPNKPQFMEYSMRTTLELPDTLVNEALVLTNIPTKTELVKFALENVIQREKIKELANYFGKITLDINLDELRKR